MHFCKYESNVLCRGHLFDDFELTKTHTMGVNSCSIASWIFIRICDHARYDSLRYILDLFKFSLNIAFRRKLLILVFTDLSFIVRLYLCLVYLNGNWYCKGKKNKRVFVSWKSLLPNWFSVVFRDLTQWIFER